MSDPLSLVVQAPVAMGRIGVDLSRPTAPCERFDDWGALGVALTEADFAHADRLSRARTAAQYLAETRRYGLGSNSWMCDLDEATGVFTAAALLTTAHLGEILAGLNILRQGFAPIGDGRPGFALFAKLTPGSGPPPMAVHFSGGNSMALAPESLMAQELTLHAGGIARAMNDKLQDAFDAARAAAKSRARAISAGGDGDWEIEAREVPPAPGTIQVDRFEVLVGV